MVWIKREILFILGFLPLLVHNAHHERRPSQNFGQFFPGVNSVGGTRPTRPPSTMSRPPPPPITGRPLTSNSRPPMMSRPPLATDRPLPSNSQPLTRPQSAMSKPKSKPPSSSASRRPQTNSQRFCRSNSKFLILLELVSWTLTLDSIVQVFQHARLHFKSDLFCFTLFLIPKLEVLSLS